MAYYWPIAWSRTYYNYDGTTEVQEFTAKTDVFATCLISPVREPPLDRPDPARPFTIRLDIYENGAIQPTRTQNITWR